MLIETVSSKLVNLVVVAVDSCFRDFVTAHGLIPLFSRPSPLPMELAQFSAPFPTALRFRRARHPDYSASPAAFVWHSASALLMVNYRIDRERSDFLFRAPWLPLRLPQHQGVLSVLPSRSELPIPRPMHLPLGFLPRLTLCSHL
jgi:hypothetical protein